MNEDGRSALIQAQKFGIFGQLMTKNSGNGPRSLERASRVARGLEPAPEPSRVQRERLTVPPTQHTSVPNTQQEEDRDWQQVEALVSRIVGTRDALRRLVKDMAPRSSYSAYKFSSIAWQHRYIRRRRLFCYATIGEAAFLEEEIQCFAPYNQVC